MLKDINFAKSIKDKDINYNFNYLEEKMNNDRLVTAGSGIIKGIDITVKDFKINITKGSIVDNNGNLIEIEDKEYYITKPDLIFTKEDTTISSNGEIKLLNIPYSLNRLTTVEYEKDEAMYGITVNNYKNYNEIPIINTIKDVILVDTRYKNLFVSIKYYYSLPRIDTVYIDKNFNIKILKGTPSVSPSASLPNEYIYILKFIKIDPFYIDNNHLFANCYVLSYQKPYRKIVVNDNDELMLNGISTNNMSFIYTSCPTEPTVKDLWFDLSINKLKCWKEDIMGNGYWSVVNDNNDVIITDTKLWKPHENPDDLQTFIFEKDKINYRFIPGTNALNINIDNTILMSDQYEEIIDYGDTNINNGIGFKLSSKLSKAKYVEAKVSHNTKENKQDSVLQRTACFVDSDSIKINQIMNTFQTKSFYLIGENQLEIFVNGVRLNSNEYIEGSDLSIENRKNKQKSNQFKILSNLNLNDIVTYKIITNIFSYNSILELVTNIKTEIDNFYIPKMDKIDENLLVITNKINKLNSFNLNIKKQPKFITSDFSNTSFILIYDIDVNRLLVKNKDYFVNTENNITTVNFNDSIIDNTNIYITGINI